MERLGATSILLLFSAFHASSLVQSQDVKDYCQGEVFKASCSSDQVVVMKRAMYGRMRQERCVKIDMGHRGCKADVLEPAHLKCSGLRSCHVMVPEQAFEALSACMELQNYLEASYECLEVSKVDGTDCRNNRPLKANQIGKSHFKEEGSIASVSTKETYCGTQSSPWVVKGEVGQRVKLSLEDFSAPRQPKKMVVPTGLLEETECVRVATVEEREAKGKVKVSKGVCRNVVRLQNIYASESNQVFVMLVQADSLTSNFLIHYRLIGCPDMLIPANHNLWFKRINTLKALIGCKLSDKKWEVTCDVEGGNEWVGEFANCTEALVAMVSGRESLQDYHRVNRPALIVASVLLVIVVVVVLLLSIMCYRRNRYSHKHHHHHHQCRQPPSIKNKTYSSDDDFFDHHHSHHSHNHHHHSHHQQPPHLSSTTTYNTRSLRYASYHGNAASTQRSPSPSSRGAYSEYSATAAYETMDDNYIDDDDDDDGGGRRRPSDDQSPPPLPKKMKATRATAVSVSDAGEKVTHIWQMPLPVPGE